MTKNFFLGGDVSKGYVDIALLDDRKKIVEKKKQFYDTHQGHQEFYSFLKDFCNEHKDAKIYAGFESTGGYENNWIHFLKQLKSEFNISVARVNPYGVKYYSKSTLKRTTTDKISAINIAEYLIANSEKVTYDEEEKFAHLRRIWKQYKNLTKVRTQFLNSLNNLIYSSNPELLSYWGDKVPRWLLILIHKYPTARHLSLATQKELKKIPFIKNEYVPLLIENAKKSVASRVDDGTAKIIRELAGYILRISEDIKDYRKEIEKMAEGMEEVEILQSFKGIALESAVGIIIQIEEINRFPSAKDLASYFGLHPVFKQSGDGSSKSRMSKKGRKEMRTILYNVARSAITCNEYIAEIYNKYISRGKARMSAIGAIMHKILRIIYGMLKRKERYNPLVDKNNRIKHHREIIEKREKLINALKNEVLRAPISRRHYRKIFKQMVSEFKPSTINSESS